MKFTSLAVFAIVANVSAVKIEHHRHHFINHAALGTNVDINMRSDPICGSGGCVKFKNPLDKGPAYPMNYKVADFGVDEDIAASLKHSEDLNAADYSGEEFKVDKKFKL